MSTVISSGIFCLFVITIIPTVSSAQFAQVDDVLKLDSLDKNTTDAPTEDVRNHLLRGEPVYFDENLPEGEREIKAEWITEALNNKKPVDIENAVIIGDLDLRTGKKVSIDSDELKGVLEQERINKLKAWPYMARYVCLVSSDIRIVDSTFKGNVIAGLDMDRWSAVVFLAKTSFGGTQFSGKETDFYMAQFSGEGTSFLGARFSGKETNFMGAEFKSKDYTWFDGASFSGERTYFSRARFSSKDTGFGSTEFLAERTYFRNAQFSGERTSFDSARFSGEETNFSDAQFSGERTYFSDVQFSGEKTDFSGVQFSDEETSFLGARFSGKETDFIKAEFKGTVDFSNATFNTKSNFIEATFGENVNFLMVVFEKDALFTMARFTDDVDLRHAIYPHLHISWPQLAGHLDGTLRRLNETLKELKEPKDRAEGQDKTVEEWLKEELYYEKLSRLRFTNLVLWRKAYFRLIKNFEDIGDKASADAAYYHYRKNRPKFKTERLGVVSAELAQLPAEVKFPKHFNKKILFWKSNHEKKLLQFKGVMSKRERDRLRELSQDDSYQNAVEILYNKSQDLPEYIVGHSGWGKTKRGFEYVFFGLTCGYGVRPLRPLAVGGVLIVLFTLIYFSKRTSLEYKVRERGKKKGRYKNIHFSEMPWYQRLGNCFYFSVSSFATVGFGRISPRGYFKVAAIIECIFGWLTMALFLVTLANVWLR